MTERETRPMASSAESPIAGHAPVRQPSRLRCEDLGVPSLDFHDAFAASGRSLYVPVDGHFNAAGHTLFAESLDRFVVANLPPANRIALPDIER